MNELRVVFLTIFSNILSPDTLHKGTQSPLAGVNKAGHKRLQERWGVKL